MVTSSFLTNALSSSTSVSTSGITAKSWSFVAASQTNSTALPFKSTAGADQPRQNTASSALSSSTKAGVGVGVTFGASLAGLLIYFLVRRLRRQARRDMARAGTSRTAPLGSRRYEKAELTGEDARKEMNAAAESREAELPGNGTNFELEATPAENGGKGTP